MKKKYIKVLLILLSIVLLAISCYLYNSLKKDYILSIKKISENKLTEIIDGKEETTFEYLNVLLNNEDITKTYVGDYYIVQKNDEVYEGSLSTIGGRYKKVIVDPGVSKLELMESGQPLKLILYTNTNYQIINIYITYIPIIEISGSELYQEVEGSKSIYKANMSLYSYKEDSLYNKETYSILDHVKGNSTTQNTKKNYKVSLIDENEKSLKKSLLDMRKDDDWVLLSMGLDGSLIKEKLSMDIWSLVNNGENVCKMKYVELFMDNEYKGLYLLCEHLDLKTFDADKDDFLVSIKDWYSDLYKNITPEAVYSARTGKNKWILNDIQVKNATENDFEKIAKIDEALHNLWFGEDTTLFNFNYQNCLNYSVFIQMTVATDNTYKNERLLLEKNGNSYDVTKTAWDFDWNFLEEYAESEFNDYVLPSEYKNGTQYKKDCANLYKKLKDFYNKETLINMIEEYNQYIIKSGASTRIVENSWYLNDWNYDNAVEDLKEIVSKRVEFLDEYYENILKEAS